MEGEKRKAAKRTKTTAHTTAHNSEGGHVKRKAIQPLSPNASKRGKRILSRGPRTGRKADAEWGKMTVLRKSVASPK